VRRNPATRTQRLPFHVQVLRKTVLRKMVPREVWGDVKDTIDLPSAIAYAKAQWHHNKQNRTIRVKHGRAVVWINECPCDDGDGEGCPVHGFGS